MKLLINPEEVWYEIPVPESKRAYEYFKQMSATEKSTLRSRAAALYEEQSQKYRKGKEMSPADRRWLETVLREGTQNDKISAMLLQAKESPFYGLEWITKLLAIASGTSRHESFPAIDALREIFLLILPPKATGRTLTAWKDRPLTNDKELTPTTLLLLAYFEDVLRQAYVDYIKLLEIMLHDQVQNGREKALRVVYELALSYKSDLTETLILLLVNKLGDSRRIIASRVVYYLQCILDKHEKLTLVTVKEVQKVATKTLQPNDKPAFYGLTFFSQIRLNEQTPEVTQILLQTYQYFLEIFLSQLQEVSRKEKMLHKRKRAKSEGGEEEDIPRVTKVVLLGLTRAIPFVRSTGTGEENLYQYGSKLLAIADKIRSFPTLLQAAGLIFKILIEGQNISEASLQLLTDLVSKHLLFYARMAETTASHPQLFKFLYKIFSSLSESANPKAMEHLGQMIKSLLSLSILVANPAFSAAALLLLNEVLVMKPGLRLSIIFPDDDQSGNSLFLELNILSRHYHPTVARYASTLLQAKGEIDISKEPDDPFLSMNTSSFLEGFIGGTLDVK